MRLKNFAATVFIAFFLFPLAAQNRNLSVEEAVKLALEQNASIGQSKISLSSAKREKAHSWNSVSPSLTLGGTYSSPNEKDSYDWRLSGTAGISLLFSPSLFTSIKTAKLNYEKELISYEQMCRSIELSVRTSFYSLLYDQEYISLQKRRLETAKRQYDQNSVKYNNGRIPEIDVLSARVKYEKLKPQVEEADITFLNNVDTFKKLLNIDADKDLTLSGSLDDIMNLVEKDIASGRVEDWVNASVSVRSLEKQLEAAEAALTASRAAVFGPSINAGWNYQPSLTDKSEGKTTDGGSLSLSVSIPLDGLLPWSSKADTVASAKDNIAALKIKLDEAKRSASVSINNYVRQIKQTQSTIKSLQINEELAERTYEMTLDAYNRGTKDYLTLQDASDSLFEARLSVKSKLYTLISTILNLESVSGSPFGTLAE
ncbi:TolC family protein [Treponema parvum]|uniref:TolC family protein n=1 Tax=Treponema parvum TaxID=138851 RepID=UPI001AEBBF4B|nr:TolC family protein [Treponema parvum]QTQ15370.1 TolC family protein [Treponema parvum]